MKKVFIISLVLLIICSVIFGIWFFVFRQAPLVENVEIFEEGTPSEETIEKNVFGTLSQITHTQTLAPTLTSGGSRLRYINADNGNVTETDLSGSNAKIIFKNDFANIGHATWSRERNALLVQSKDDQSYFIYDINTQSKAPFKDSVDYAQWMISGDRVLYKYFDAATNKRSLNIAQDDGSNWKELADLPWRNTSFAQVPQSSTIAFWNAPNAYEKMSLQRANVTGGDTTNIFNSVFGGDALFSPKGTSILISSSEEEGGHAFVLGVANKNGGEYRTLGIPTLTDKAVWSQDEQTVYYALPNEIPDGSILPNDWHDEKFLSSDSFWKVDITTGKKERILPLKDISQKIDAQDLFITPSENFLFFLNRVDGNIYRIEL